ncbi:hypothetical protein J1614_007697 [Plenodomus biglobosus]|nr:hypothetical protein J1614_007697 [Plenodomus biglobosus]
MNVSKASKEHDREWDCTRVGALMIGGTGAVETSSRLESFGAFLSIFSLDLHHTTCVVVMGRVESNASIERVCAQGDSYVGSPEVAVIFHVLEQVHHGWSTAVFCVGVSSPYLVNTCLFSRLVICSGSTVALIGTNVALWNHVFGEDSRSLVRFCMALEWPE